MPRRTCEPGTVRRASVCCWIGCLVLGAADAARAAQFFGLSGDRTLISFNQGTQGTPESSIAISGLQVDEVVLGLDSRPANGELFALGSSNRLYRLNVDSAVATPIGAGPFAVPLVGTSFAMDFDPTSDLLRVVSDSGQNLLIDPTTGAVASVASALAYAPGDANFGTTPRIGGIAYYNNLPGAQFTRLFGIDFNLDVLVEITDPDARLVRTNGSFGFDGTDVVAFEIVQEGRAFAALQHASLTTSTLHQLNVLNGSVMHTPGSLGRLVNGLTEVIPEPACAGAASTLAWAQLMSLRRRRHPRHQRA
jgi:hypothetical protein